MTILAIDDHLELRALGLAHADAWYAAVDANRAYLSAWVPTPARARSRAEAPAYMERCEIERRNGTGHFFGIWSAGTLIGEILLFGIRPEAPQGEVGYWLREDQQGQGIVTRAARAILAFGFNELGLERIELRCAVENQKSRAIAERLGFTREGTLRQAHRVGERNSDQALYALLASDWRENVEDET